MARAKKDGVGLSLRIDRSVSDRLDKFCQDSGQSKTVAVERALDMYIRGYYAKQALLDEKDG